MTRPEIGSLTGVRGVAAALVMVDHYAAVDFTAPFPMDMLPHMYLAVDMFMILSGFILAMTYGDRLAGLPRGQAYRLFLWRRIARLYPMYALTTLICFGLCRAGWLTFLNPDTSFAALAANLLAVQTWWWPGTSLNGPGWSISTEWFANLVFPLLIPLLLGGSARLAARLATGMAVAGLALLVCSAIMFGQLFDVPSPGAVNTISGPGALGRCLGEFVMGMYCWRLRQSAAWTRVLRGDAVQLGLLALLILLMQDTVLDTVAVVVCALLLIGLSFEASATAAALRSAPLLWLGGISYSVYLLHITLMPVRDWLAAAFRDAGLAGASASWGLAVACCAAATLGLATLARRFVERPAQAALLLAGSGQGAGACRQGAT